MGNPLMRPGEIYLAKFPFGDAPGMEIRPVLLLTGPVGAVPETLVAYISSVIPPRLLPSDLILDPSAPEFRSTNLKTPSALRLHKLATIHCSSLARYLGAVDSRAWPSVASRLRALLGL
jgi:mRNA interferase MazF